MSHWTKVKTEIKDQALLEKALKQLGWKYETGNFKVTQYGTTEKAEIKFENALGLSRQEDGTWAMVGDPFHCSGPMRKYYGKGDVFARDLSTAYSVVEAKDKLEDQGFECIENENAVVGPDGKITMTYQSLNY